VIIAEREGVVLRHAQKDDFPKIDEITILYYTDIQTSYVSMLGEDCYQAVRHNPELTWQERKTGQVHRLFAEHPEWIWVLDRRNEVFGFVTFYLFPEQHYGHIDNNGVHPAYTGQGWGKFMYRCVLKHFLQQGLRFAHVDTGLDPAHDAARRAYEAVGFDRKVPVVEYWQDLMKFKKDSGP
jgi:ribosomal protein S18 acetylase RimI-like enzyme